ncbi:hypothetical protein [Pseudomonas akapageensis]|nr:hypothetical protein [Pseudomonas akapageensis]
MAKGLHLSVGLHGLAFVREQKKEKRLKAAFLVASRRSVGLI